MLSITAKSLYPGFTDLLYLPSFDLNVPLFMRVVSQATSFIVPAHTATNSSSGHIMDNPSLMYCGLMVLSGGTLLVGISSSCLYDDSLHPCSLSHGPTFGLRAVVTTTSLGQGTHPCTELSPRTQTPRGSNIDLSLPGLCIVNFLVTTPHNHPRIGKEVPISFINETPTSHTTRRAKQG